MTPTDTGTAAQIIRSLWPRCRWEAEEWNLFAEKVAHIEIDAEQARAALRNLKATSDKYPTIAAVLKALANAQAKKIRTAEAAEAKGYTRPVIDTVGGLTSFEWRVIQDPRFREFARKHGRLSPEREAQVEALAGQEAQA